MTISLEVAIWAVFFVFELESVEPEFNLSKGAGVSS